jgi:hypothetical protein
MVAGEATGYLCIEHVDEPLHLIIDASLTYRMPTNFNSFIIPLLLNSVAKTWPLSPFKTP